jgi:hypothetical protein
VVTAASARDQKPPTSGSRATCSRHRCSSVCGRGSPLLVVASVFVLNLRQRDMRERVMSSAFLRSATAGLEAKAVPLERSLRYGECAGQSRVCLPGCAAAAKISRVAVKNFGVLTQLKMRPRFIRLRLEHFKGNLLAHHVTLRPRVPRVIGLLSRLAGRSRVPSRNRRRASKLEPNPNVWSPSSLGEDHSMPNVPLALDAIRAGSTPDARRDSSDVVTNFSNARHRKARGYLCVVTQQGHVGAHALAARHCTHAVEQEGRHVAASDAARRHLR